MRRALCFALCALLLAACQAAAPQAGALAPAQTAVVSPVPAAYATLTPELAAATPSMVPASTVPASAVPENTASSLVQAAQPSPTQPRATQPPLSQACEIDESVCILGGHFLLQRPVPLDANPSVDESYRYGLTQSGKREPHHGVEFPNAQNTPVLAVAAGEVVFAGDDKNVSLSWVPAYYGNVVVIEHRFSGQTRAIYSLYAHLFKIEVAQGDKVGVGQVIGRVGATGTAIGSHLHFEVRVDRNDYRSNRNPDLWLVPLAGTGVLAGRIQDAQGRLLDGMLNVQRIENGVLNPLPVTALETYIRQESQPVQSDDAWQENFAAGELKAGQYRLTLHLNGQLYEKIITIEAGRLTFVVFVAK